MDLDAYFKRIDYRGPARPDLATLKAVHHQHVLHIPYENIDVQLGRPLDFDIARIFDKLVNRRRGGWCYEMNGLLAWAFTEIGFDVRRMSGAVMRATQGDTQLGNHLVLEVDLDEPYLADVGLGDGLREPIPLAEGEHRQGYLNYRLEEMEDGFWRFHNHDYSNVASFDFKHATADENELEGKCAWLQSDPSSPFKQLLIAQRFDPDHIHVQLGRVATTIARNGKTTDVIDSVAALNDRMATTFGVDEDLTSLWPEICAAHERYFES